MTIGEGKDERLAFAADQKNLRFVAPAPLYSRAPFDPGSERFEAIRSTAPMILTTGFETIEFEYFGAEMEKDLPDWTPAWREDAELLPSAIRIRTRTQFGGAGWPDLFFKLRSGVKS
jgi:hypothetical protein